jgi:hypothetical protein
MVLLLSVSSERSPGAVSALLHEHLGYVKSDAKLELLAYATGICEFRIVLPPSHSGSKDWIWSLSQGLKAEGLDVNAFSFADGESE